MGRSKWLLGIVAVLAMSVVVSGRMQAPPFSVGDILSTPFPSDLTVAPAGDAIAWVQNDQGRRNIWLARVPEFVGRKVTSYAHDDGQVIGLLRFTPAGDRVIYVRGGGPNRGGEIPNPLSDPDGAKRQIWMIDLAGNEGGADPVLIGEGSSPTPSPDDTGLVFLDKGQVWWYPFEPEPDEAEGEPKGDDAEAKVNKPKSMIRPRGGVGSLRFSPNGSLLAFVSGRGDHSYIGVYDFGSKGVRYLDPGVDRDSSPVWSPQSDRIAFIRIPAAKQSRMFGPRREASPWSIRVADVATGASREIWKAEKGVGSAFSGVVADDQLFWGADDRIVFPWERDGWKHLYSVGLAGSGATLLTPGEFEVEHVRLTRDRSALVYSSNQDDIDRRHLWRVNVDEGPPLR